MKKIRKILSGVLVLCMVIMLMPAAAWAESPENQTSGGEAEPYSEQANSSIQIGDYLMMGSYYDEPILWRCVDINENGPLMLSDKILCLKAFDASGYNTNGSHVRGCVSSGDFRHWRKINGSNYWQDSNIRDWLNSNAVAGNVEWSCGNPPDAEHVSSGYNAYDDEAGFMANFTSAEQGAMKSVELKQLLDGYEYSYTRNDNYHIYNSGIADVIQNYDMAYSEISSKADKMFLLDIKQIHRVYSNGNVLGSDYYIGKPTAQCVVNAEYKSSNLSQGNNWYYWLRSPDCGNYHGDSLYGCSNRVRGISSSGSVSHSYAYGHSGGVRPAFYLDLTSSSLTFGAGTESSPYRIEEGDSVKPGEEVSKSKLKIYTNEPTKSITVGGNFKIGASVVSEGGETPDLSGISFTVENKSILNAGLINEEDGIIYCTFSGKSAGNTNIKINDSNTGETAVIDFTVNNVVGDAYTIYNFNDMSKNGIEIKNFNQRSNADGSTNISFDAYNSLHMYGAVEVRDAKGELKRAEFIDKFSDVSSLRDTAEYIWNMVTPWNWSDLYSGETHIDVDVPKGGYILISSDSEESVVCSILNVIDLTSQFAKFVKNNSPKNKELPKAMIQVIHKNSNGFVKKWAEAIAKKSVKTTITSESGVQNFAEALMEFLDSNDLMDIVKSTCVSTAADVGEDIFIEWFEKATAPVGIGTALKGIFKAVNYTETVLQVNDYCKYLKAGSIVIQVPDENKRVCSDVTVECKLDNNVGLSVYKIDTEDSQKYLINIKDLETQGVKPPIGNVGPVPERPVGPSATQILSAYDISLVYNNGEHYQPVGDITVTIALPDELKGHVGKTKIYRIESDGQATILYGVSDGTSVTFKTDHFSVYIIASSSVEGLSDVYEIKYNEAEHGSITLDKEIAAKEDTVTITVSPESGYKLKELEVTDKDGNKITVSDQGNNKFTFKMPESDVNISANFVKNETQTSPTTPNQGTSSGGGGGGSSVSKFKITAPSNVEHGKVTVDPASASKGNTVTITAAPDEGYKLDKLAVTDKNGKTIAITDAGDNKYTFVMPDSKVDIVVSFIEDDKKFDDDNNEKQNQPNWTNPYSDVAANAWYFDAVKYVSENGLMNGTSVNTFAPNSNLSRAMLAQILYNKKGKPAAGVSAFTDVPTGKWFTDAVSWAAVQGVVNGLGNNTFGPNNNITREQLAVMLFRYAKSPETAGSVTGFNDASQISGYATDAMVWATSEGIMNGKGDGRLDPKGLATRAEVAQMMKNYLN